MNTKEISEPAFPGQWVHGGGQIESWTGMTLRDYFAAKALAAMIAKNSKEGSLCGASGVNQLTAFAYEYADAMLEARRS